MELTNATKSVIIALAGIIQSLCVTAAAGAGTEPAFSGSASFVTFTPEKGATCLWDASHKEVGILTDESDYRGVIMAAGNFVSGSSIELSADGPIKPPYSVYFQGGLTWPHGKFGILKSLQSLVEAGIVLW